MITTDNTLQFDSPGYNNSVTQSFTVSGTDRLLLVAVASKDVDLITSVTYGGVALSLVEESHIGGVAGISLFSLVAPATGANDLIVNLSGYKLFSVFIHSFTDVDQATPIEVSKSTAGGYGESMSEDITTITDNAMIWGAMNINSDATLTPASGTTEESDTDHSDANLGTMGVFSKSVATPGTEFSGFSWTGSTNHITSLLAIREAGAVVAVPRRVFII